MLLINQTGNAMFAISQNSSSLPKNGITETLQDLEIAQRTYPLVLRISRAFCGIELQVVQLGIEAALF